MTESSGGPVPGAILWGLGRGASNVPGPVVYMLQCVYTGQHVLGGADRMGLSLVNGWTPALKCVQLGALVQRGPNVHDEQALPLDPVRHVAQQTQSVLQGGWGRFSVPDAVPLHIPSPMALTALSWSEIPGHSIGAQRLKHWVRPPEITSAT